MKEYISNDDKLTYNNVFIIGCPRSGKTLLQGMIGFHESFAWFSQYNSSLPQVPAVGILNRIYDIPLINKLLINFVGLKFFPHPIEMLKNYNKILATNGSLDGKQVLEEDKLKLETIFNKQLKYQNKNKFIADYGRPARMLYFNEIFPNSKFIHVIRDGRAVTADFLQNRLEWFHPSRNLYSYYKNVPDSINEHLKHNKKHYILALASLRWKMAIYEIEKQSLKLRNDQYLVVKYENIIDDKFRTVDIILRFLDLKWTPRLKKIVSNKIIRRNNEWKSSFSEDQNKALMNMCRDTLIKYKYL